MPNESRSSTRGAGLFNEEVEVGYDIGFEARWHRIETVGQVLMLAGVLAAASGLLGRGPLSHRTVRSPRASLTVDFEPLARYGTTTLVTIHFVVPVQRSDATSDVGHYPARLRVSDRFVEPMGLQNIFPAPLESAPAGGDIRYTFMLPQGADTGVVRFVLKPSKSGSQHLTARLGTETVSWTQWVVP